MWGLPQPTTDEELKIASAVNVITVHIIFLFNGILNGWYVVGKIILINV